MVKYTSERENFYWEIFALGKSVKRVDVPPGAMDSQRLKALAWEVFQYQYFDGIIIHAPALDIPFYGTALTLMLKNFRHPVVFFSREEQSEEAEEWAKLGFSGIFAMGDDGFDLACRTTLEASGRLHSPRYPAVGHYDGFCRVVHQHLLPMEETDPFLMCDALNTSVLLIRPDCSLEERPDVLEVRGLVISLSSEEDVRWLLEGQMGVLRTLHRKKIPVLVTGLPSEVVDPVRRRQLLLSGILPAGDMTPEAAAVKLMWTLARTGSSEGVKLYFGLSFGGEVTQK